ncbi:hypothetical protein [Clostridium sp.]|uniref:hypothetical protein n=1 Tax=Clostridium sp. TaxID=1506 RepID=UPI003F39B6C9
MNKNINNLIKRYEKITEYTETVSNEYLGNSSFYLLPDGRFLNCACDYGTRGDDHRIIFGATKLNYGDFEKLHRNYKLIRLIPECGTALIKGRQQPTREQQEALKELDFEIEKY